MTDTIRAYAHHGRHRAKPTFTSWRGLFLLLSFCIPLGGMWLGIAFAPNSKQWFQSTIEPGGKLVVEQHLVPSSYMAPPLDPIGTAVHQVCLDDIATAIQAVS